MDQRNFRILLLSLPLVLASGCEFQQGVPDAGVIPPREAAELTSVNGFTFDVEYYLATLITCDQDCLDPALFAGDPNVEGAKVFNAQISALAPGGAALGGNSAGLTGYDGVYVLTDIPTPDQPYLYMRAEVDTAAELPEGDPADRAWSPETAWIPPYSYLPTTSVDPIYTHHQACLYRRATLLGDKGILEAIALYQTTMGTPTTVADLVDPAKTGGVLVWLNMSFSELWLWLPAFGSGTEFSAGTPYSVTWAPPGEVPGLSSELGFIVDDTNDPELSIGLAVSVLPPTSEPFTEVMVTSVDPFEELEFAPRSIRVRPGEISYGEALPGEPMFFEAPAPPEFCATPL